MSRMCVIVSESNRFALSGRSLLKIASFKKYLLNLPRSSSCKSDHVGDFLRGTRSRSLCKDILRRIDFSSYFLRISKTPNIQRGEKVECLKVWSCQKIQYLAAGALEDFWQNFGPFSLRPSPDRTRANLNRVRPSPDKVRRGVNQVQIGTHN